MREKGLDLACGPGRLAETHAEPSEADQHGRGGAAERPSPAACDQGEGYAACDDDAPGMSPSALGFKSQHCKIKTAAPLGVTVLFWCGRRDLNPHVYGWTQAPQACLSTYSSTPANASKAKAIITMPLGNVKGKFSPTGTGRRRLCTAPDGGNARRRGRARGGSAPQRR